MNVKFRWITRKVFYPPRYPDDDVDPESFQWMRFLQVRYQGYWGGWGKWQDVPDAGIEQ